MKSSNVSAVIFVKHLRKVSDFYSKALGMDVSHSDVDHTVLNCRGFDLVVHQIPQHIAGDIAIHDPPKRRTSAAISLSFPVRNVTESRQLARSLGGKIDDSPPEWAEADANIFQGHDPEGNEFKISEHP